MDALAPIERKLAAARKRDDNPELARLIPRALELPEAQPHLVEYLDELSYAYEQLGRFDEAIDATRRAVAAGWDGEFDEHPSAQALIADLLLRAGRTQEAGEAWLEAERQDPRDPWVHHAAGSAYTKAGLHTKALPWQTKGLELALEAGEEEGERAWFLTEERADNLAVLGRAPDELQLRAEAVVEDQERQARDLEEAFLGSLGTAPGLPPQRVSAGVAWFPAGQTRVPCRPGRASPRTTSTDPTRPTARGSSCCSAISKRRASRGSR